MPPGMTGSWRDPWVHGSVPHSPVPPPDHPSFNLHEVVQTALDEDTAGLGDITSQFTVNPHLQAVGTFLAKEDGIVAGLSVADAVFNAVDPSLRIFWSRKDCDTVSSGTVIGIITGNARSLLLGERVALNFVQRMSGIASATSELTKAVKGTKARIIETRKTAPGLRVLDKWAVLIGGGSNHRMGLFDMVMIKDNHVTAAGGIAPAVKRCQEHAKRQKMQPAIEVETRTLDEVHELMDMVKQGEAPGVTRIMLDNMAVSDPSKPGGVDVSMLQKAVDVVDGRLETEASGNITSRTIREVAKTGVSFISCGVLTHSVDGLDMSLKIKLLQGDSEPARNHLEPTRE